MRLPKWPPSILCVLRTFWACCSLAWPCLQVLIIVQNLSSMGVREFSFAVAFRSVLLRNLGCAFTQCLWAIFCVLICELAVLFICCEWVCKLCLHVLKIVRAMASEASEGERGVFFSVHDWKASAGQP